MDTRTCRLGKDCLHPNGPTLPITEFGNKSSNKDGYCTLCKVCNRARIKKWQQDNKDKMHAYGKIYREQHPDAAREREHRWRKNNPDKARAKVKRYRDSHLDEQHERERKWRQNNPEYVRRSAQNRRSKKKELPSTFTQSDRDITLKYFNGTCAYCGHPPKLWDNPRVLHQDHFIPMNKDGGYTPDNIVSACQSCNSSKRDHDPFKWIAEHFGKRNATQISKRIADYFKWVESHDGHD